MLILAHRGAPTEHTENTLPSFEAAWQAGADVLEMDVRTSRDGALVVFHDATVDRMSGVRGDVHAMTLAELQALPLRAPKHLENAGRYKIPTFQEILTALPDAPLNVDLKAVSAAGVRQVHADVAASATQAPRTRRILLTSADANTQRLIRALPKELFDFGFDRNEVLHVLAAATLRWRPHAGYRGLAFQAPAHITVWGRPVTVFTPAVQRYLQALHCPVHLWWQGDAMFDSPARLQWAQARGVDGVFTNAVRSLASGPR